MIQWHPHLNALLSGGLILAAAAWCYVLYRRLSAKTDPRRARLMLVPKAAVLLLVILALMEPTWVAERKPDARGRILVLRDVSASMSVNDAGKTRDERARNILSKLEKDLAPDFAVEAKVFDTEIRDAKSGRQPQAATDGRGTDLAGCLRTLSERADLSAYRSVIVLTDGGDDRPEDVIMPALPVSFVGIGGESPAWNDVSIAEAVFPPSVEQETEFEVAVELQAPPGAEPSWVKTLSAVRLRLEAQAPAGMQTIAETKVDLSLRRAFVKFKATASTPGPRTYRVAIEPVKGELTALNNSRTCAVDVRRKAIHVLYVTRELGMDFKILRNEIGRDPGIAFTALYRTLGEKFTVQGDRLQSDRDLDAGLPARAQALESYDCVVIGSFPAAEWNPAQMEALRTYVEKGGNAIFMGGEHSFGHGGYAGTPLAPLMPWQISGDEPDLQRGSFPVNVAPMASAQPMVAGIDALLAEATEPALDSVNIPGPLRAGAASLLEARLGRQTIFVMAVQSFGRGKVLGIASNSLWKWARKSKPLGLAFAKIWRQAIRNLAGEAEGGRILSVTWDKGHYRPGAEARAEIRVSGKETSGNVQLRAALAHQGETAPIAVEPLQGAGNGYTARLPLRRAGEYVFKLTAYQMNAVLEGYEKTLTAGPLLPEGARLDVDEGYLEKLASKTGGMAVRPGRLYELTSYLKCGLLERNPVVEIPLAQKGPWFFLLVLAFLVAEWILRRRFFPG